MAVDGPSGRHMTVNDTFSSGLYEPLYNRSPGLRDASTDGASTDSKSVCFYPDAYDERTLAFAGECLGLTSLVKHLVIDVHWTSHN